MRGLCLAKMHVTEYKATHWLRVPALVCDCRRFFHLVVCDVCAMYVHV
jgi:hypothetical protein